MDYEYSNLPFGLAMNSLFDERSETGGRTLTEAEKEEMIFRYKDAENENQKEQIRNAVPPEENVRDLFGGPGIG